MLLEKNCNTRLKLCVVCFIKHNKLKSSNRSTKRTNLIQHLLRAHLFTVDCSGAQLALLACSGNKITFFAWWNKCWSRETVCLIFFFHGVRRSYSLIIQIDRKTATDLLFRGTSVALCFRIHTSYDNWKFDSMQILQVLSFGGLLRHNIFNKLNVWWFKTTKSQNSHWEISFLLKNLPSEEDWGKSMCM